MRSKTFVGTSITPNPDYTAIARAFDAHGDTVEHPGQVRPALLRDLHAVANGRAALLDIRLAPVNEP